MQKELKDWMQESGAHLDFMQPGTAGHSQKRASAEQEGIGRRLRRAFFDNIAQAFPEADICSMLFSPHALIDTMFGNIPNTGAFEDAYSAMIWQGGFLFYELSDPFCLEAQWSFSDIYLNQSDLFKNSDKDYALALDFAIGLGADIDTAASRSRTSAYLENDRLPNQPISAKSRQHMQFVKAIYQAVGAICHRTVRQLTDEIRKTTRLFMMSQLHKRSMYSDQDKTELHHALATALSLNDADARNVNLHLPFMLYEIVTIDDFLCRFAEVFIRTMNRQIMRRTIIQDNHFSTEQIRLIHSNAEYICSNANSALTITIVQRKILENHQNTSEALKQTQSAQTTEKTESASECRIQNWPFNDSSKQPLVNALSCELRSVVQEYMKEIYRVVRRKAHDVNWDMGSALQVCEFICSEDLFVIDTDGHPDSYAEDRWSIERFMDSWPADINFDIWGFPEDTVPHRKAYQWMKEQDSALGRKSWEHYIDRQIKLHPQWSVDYRQHRSFPWYNGFHADFLRHCLKECKAPKEPIPLSAYPYPDNVARPFQLRGKYFPEMLLEEKLQTAMYRDSREKLLEIRDALCKAEHCE